MDAPNRREVLRALLVGSVAGLLATPRVGGAEEQFASVRQRIAAEIASGKATGVAVAVVHKGRIVWEEGFGFADRERDIAATARTPFCLASLTKPFTTTVLMTLAAEGKIDLGAPGNRYLSGYEIKGGNGNPEGATVRLLGAHASGLPAMFIGYFKDGPERAPDAKTILEEYGRLAYAPGSVYEYSNIGFSALGAIASNVTGIEFPALLEQRVLQPLGLSDSFFSSDLSRLPTRAIGYDEAGKPIPYYSTSTPPSGELYMSAHDLAHFAMWNMKNPVAGQAKILEPRWIDELHKPVFAGPAGIATTFGWFTGQLKTGADYICKSGGQPGVATKLYMVPSAGLACLVLTNRSNGTDMVNGLCDSILKSYLPEWVSQEEDAGPPSKPFVETRPFLGRWKGTLRNGGVEQGIDLEVAADRAAKLGLGNGAAAELLEVRSRGADVEGMLSGTIGSDADAGFGARKLEVKLLPQDGRLLGRVSARGVKRGLVSANVPYVLALDKATRGA